MIGVLTTLGHVIAIGAVVAFVVGVFYGFSRDVARWWGESRQPEIRLSDCANGFIEDEDEAETLRMRTVRRHLDELWEDDEDPRDAFADAALDYWEFVQGLPERKVAS